MFDGLFDGTFISYKYLDGDNSFVFIPKNGFFGYHLGRCCGVIVDGFETLDDHKAHLSHEWSHLDLGFEDCLVNCDGFPAPWRCLSSYRWLSFRQAHPL